VSELVDGDGNALTLRTILRGLGCSDEDLDQAEAAGTLQLLAVERLVMPEPSYGLEQAAEMSGLAPEQIEQLWRSLGFPQPHPGEKLFTEAEVDNFKRVAAMIADGIVAPELAVQMTRVIGSSVARISSALVDVITSREQGQDHDADLDLTRLAGSSDVLLETIPSVLEQVWRRHLQVAARRRLLRGAEHDEGPGVVVGFADLVGFTAMSQTLSEEELAALVGRFETLSYDAVLAGGGRVVKMIGDEVMFTVEDPRAAAEIALALAEASRDDEDLTDVRVGMAIGPVLEREGDLFGPTVNLASRITAIAFPGSVVVSTELQEALGDDESFAWRSMRPRYLKNIGRVTLWVLRRAGDRQPSMLANIVERRADFRTQIKEAIAERLLEPDAT
jgi:adenylate cyclase